MYYGNKTQKAITDFKNQIDYLESTDEFLVAREKIYEILEQEIKENKNFSGIEKHEFQFQRALVDMAIFLRLANEIIFLKKQIK